jgi:hypothetical protein
MGRATPNLTFSRRGPAMLMVERLGHKVVEKWQRSQQSGQDRRTTPRDDAEYGERLVKQLYGCGCQQWSC